MKRATAKSFQLLLVDPAVTILPSSWIANEVGI
jgi:hypothetical protein